MKERETEFRYRGFLVHLDSEVPSETDRRPLDFQWHELRVRRQVWKGRSESIHRADSASCGCQAIFTTICRGGGLGRFPKIVFAYRNLAATNATEP